MMARRTVGWNGSPSLDIFYYWKIEFIITNGNVIMDASFGGLREYGGSENRDCNRRDVEGD